MAEGLFPNAEAQTRFVTAFESLKAEAAAAPIITRSTDELVLFGLNAKIGGFL